MQLKMPICQAQQLLAAFWDSTRWAVRHTNNCRANSAKHAKDLLNGEKNGKTAGMKSSIVPKPVETDAIYGPRTESIQIEGNDQL